RRRCSGGGPSPPAAGLPRTAARRGARRSLLRGGGLSGRGLLGGGLRDLLLVRRCRRRGGGGPGRCGTAAARAARATATFGGGACHAGGQIASTGPLALGALLLAGDPLPGEEHVHRAAAAGLLPGVGGRARARTKLLLRRRGRAGARDQGAESSTESSLLRHGRCPSEKSVAVGCPRVVRAP